MPPLFDMTGLLGDGEHMNEAPSGSHSQYTPCASSPSMSYRTAPSPAFTDQSSTASEGKVRESKQVVELRAREGDDVFAAKVQWLHDTHGKGKDPIIQSLWTSSKNGPLPIALVIRWVLRVHELRRDYVTSKTPIVPPLPSSRSQDLMVLKLPHLAVFLDRGVDWLASANRAYNALINPATMENPENEAVKRVMQCIQQNKPIPPELNDVTGGIGFLAGMKEKGKTTRR